MNRDNRDDDSNEVSPLPLNGRKSLVSNIFSYRPSNVSQEDKSNASMDLEARSPSAHEQHRSQKSSDLLFDLAPHLQTQVVQGVRGHSIGQFLQSPTHQQQQKSASHAFHVQGKASDGVYFNEVRNLRQISQNLEEQLSVIKDVVYKVKQRLVQLAGEEPSIENSNQQESLNNVCKDLLQLLEDGHHTINIDFLYCFASPIIYYRYKKGRITHIIPSPSLPYRQEFNNIKRFFLECERQIRIDRCPGYIEQIQRALLREPVGMHFAGLAYKANKENRELYGLVGSPKDTFLFLEDRQSGNQAVRDTEFIEYLQNSIKQVKFVMVSQRQACNDIVASIFVKAGAQHVIYLKEYANSTDSQVNKGVQSFYSNFYSQRKSACESFEKMEYKQLFELIVNHRGNECKYQFPELHNGLLQFLYEHLSFVPRIPIEQNFSILGRQRDAHFIVQTITHSKTRLMTIKGIPGIGKTWIINYITEYLIDRKVFLDGVVYINARYCSSTKEFMQKLYDSFRIHRAKTFEEFIQDTELCNVLLVVDHATRLIQEDKEIFAETINQILIYCSKIKVLIVSEILINYGQQEFKENAYPLRGIDPEFAYALLKQKCPFEISSHYESNFKFQQQMKESDEIWDHELFTMLAGHPHAICIFASQMQDPTLELDETETNSAERKREEILQTYDPLGQLYKIIQSNELIQFTRQKTQQVSGGNPYASLFVSVDASLKRLQQNADQEQLDLLTLIALLPGSTNNDDLAEILGQKDISHELTRLHNYSIIEQRQLQEKNVFRLYPFMQEYVKEKLAKDQVKKIHTKLVSFFIRKVEKMTDLVYKQDSKENKQEISEQLQQLQQNIEECISRGIKLSNMFNGKSTSFLRQYKSQKEKEMIKRFKSENDEDLQLINENTSKIMRSITRKMYRRLNTHQLEKADRKSINVKQVKKQNTDVERSQCSGWTSKRSGEVEEGKGGLHEDSDDTLKTEFSSDEFPDEDEQEKCGLPDAFSDEEEEDEPIRRVITEPEIYINSPDGTPVLKPQGTQLLLQKDLSAITEESAQLDDGQPSERTSKGRRLSLKKTTGHDLIKDKKSQISSRSKSPVSSRIEEFELGSAYKLLLHYLTLIDLLGYTNDFTRIKKAFIKNPFSLKHHSLTQQSQKSIHMLLTANVLKLEGREMIKELPTQEEMERDFLDIHKEQMKACIKKFQEARKLFSQLKCSHGAAICHLAAALVYRNRIKIDSYNVKHSDSIFSAIHSFVSIHHYPGQIISRKMLLDAKMTRGSDTMDYKKKLNQARDKYNKLKDEKKDMMFYEIYDEDPERLILEGVFYNDAKIENKYSNNFEKKKPPKPIGRNRPQSQLSIRRPKFPKSPYTNLKTTNLTRIQVSKEQIPSSSATPPPLPTSPAPELNLNIYQQKPNFTIDQEKDDVELLQELVFQEEVKLNEDKEVEEENKQESNPTVKTKIPRRIQKKQINFIQNNKVQAGKSATRNTSQSPHPYMNITPQRMKGMTVGSGGYSRNKIKPKHIVTTQGLTFPANNQRRKGGTPAIGNYNMSALTSGGSRQSHFTSQTQNNSVVLSVTHMRRDSRKEGRKESKIRKKRQSTGQSINQVIKDSLLREKEEIKEQIQIIHSTISKDKSPKPFKKKPKAKVSKQKL